jgi:hypothetical protein
VNFGLFELESKTSELDGCEAMLIPLLLQPLLPTGFSPTDAPAPAAAANAVGADISFIPIATGAEQSQYTALWGDG